MRAFNLGSPRDEISVDAPKYRAFISYSHRDAAWASWLHRSLEHYRPPKVLIGTATAQGEVPKRLAPIFKDRDELPSATDLGVLINAALAGSAAQIIICSPNSAKSKWVNEEILAFKRLGREDQILCIIVGGEPNASDLPGREGEECFPPALRYRLGSDGNLSTIRTEPIAADARPGKDGKNNAKLKLISGLLGVGYDALRRREQQRRNARLFAFSCAAAAGMVLTSGLAAYALVERAAAQRQTLRAEAEARTSKKATQFLVELFKIFDPSEARGNTVTAREMLDKGAVRIQGELAKEPEIQATLMDTVGTVYMGLGLYAQARPLIDGAVAKRRQLSGLDPLDLSDSLSHQGELMALQANYDAGEKAYREAIRIESANLKDRQNQEKLASSLYGLGTLLAGQGRYKDAEESLREALERQKALYGETHAAVARTLKDLARAIDGGGDLNKAIPLMQRSVAMQRALRGSEPHPDLAEVLNDMGLLLYEKGDSSEAEKFYRESLAMNRKLLGDKHPEIANGLENVAMTVQDKGDLAGAETLYRQSLDMRRELLGPEHPEVGRTLLNLASLQYDRGETTQALANLREVLGIYRKAYPPDHPETARVLNGIGSWLTMGGEDTEADVYLEEGLAMRRRLLDAQHPDIASSLIALAILRVDQKKYAEALDFAQNAKTIYTTALSPNHWRTALAECAEGAALTGLGRYPEAEKALTHGYAILAKDSELQLVYRTLAQRYLDTLRQREKTQVADAAKQNPATP
jgi:tetratricopeptide (TPR) repeat protein